MDCDGPRDVRREQRQRYCNYTYDRSYSLTVRQCTLALITVTCMTPPYGKYDLNRKGPGSFYMKFLVSKLICHNVYTPTCDSAASDASIVLVI